MTKTDLGIRLTDLSIRPTKFSRRQILSGAGLLTLAACAPGNALPTLPINVTLPPEVTALISDANAAIAKLKGIQSALPPAAQAVISKAETVVATLSSVTNATDAASQAATLTSLLTDLLAIVPPPAAGTAEAASSVGSILTAIETWLPVVAQVAGIVLPLARRRSTGMTIEQARRVLHS